MISLADNSELPEPTAEPCKPGMPATAADVEFWKDVFSVLAPPPEDETEG